MLVTNEQFDRVCPRCPLLGTAQEPDFLSDGSISLDCFKDICPSYLLSKDASEATQRVWMLFTGSHIPFQTVWSDLMKKKGMKTLTPRERRQAARQKRILIESLQDHTPGTAWWQALQEYRQAWDTLVANYAELGEEEREKLRQIMQEKREVVEDNLDPLVLRPMMIRNGVDWIAYKRGYTQKG